MLFNLIFYFFYLRVKLSNTHLVVTMLALYEDMPNCLKIAFDHYLGLSSVVCQHSSNIFPKIYNININ